MLGDADSPGSSGSTIVLLTSSFSIFHTQVTLQSSCLKPCYVRSSSYSYKRYGGKIVTTYISFPTMKLRLPSRRSLFFPDMAPNVCKCTCPGRRLSAGALQANGLESYQFDRDWFTIKINGSGLVRTHLRCYILRDIKHEVSTTTCMETADTGETCHSGKGLLVLTSAIGKRESHSSPSRQFVAEGWLA